MDAAENKNAYNIKDITAMLDFPKEYINFVNTQTNYQKLFEKYFARHRPFLEAYDSAFSSLAPDAAGGKTPGASDENAPDAAKEQAQAAARSLIEKEHSKIESVKRWNRGMVLSGDAMLFVMFLVPGVSFYNAPSTDALAEAIVTEWNRAFPKSNIKKSDYNSIFAGFRKPGIAGMLGFR